MDVETLKQIADIISTVSNESKEAFIWYVIVAYGKGYFLGTIWAAIAVYGLKLAHGILHTLLAGESLRKAAGVYYGWSDTELQKACDVLATHYNNFKK